MEVTKRGIKSRNVHISSEFLPLLQTHLGHTTLCSPPYINHCNSEAIEEVWLTSSDARPDWWRLYIECYCETFLFFLPLELLLSPSLENYVGISLICWLLVKRFGAFPARNSVPVKWHVGYNWSFTYQQLFFVERLLVVFVSRCTKPFCATVGPSVWTPNKKITKFSKIYAQHKDISENKVNI